MRSHAPNIKAVVSDFYNKRSKSKVSVNQKITQMILTTTDLIRMRKHDLDQDRAATDDE